MRYQVSKQMNPVVWVVGWWQSRQVVQKSETKHKQVVARERRLEVELALCCYQSEQGHLPARLDELVTNYLSHVPEDPFTGKPLVYRAQGANWLLHNAGPE